MKETVAAFKVQYLTDSEDLACRNSFGFNVLIHNFLQSFAMS